ncbi:MAG: hypothetical protein UT67_C0012G0007 [Candidatus Magasanikbacteria bacterium GW2011_GWA2_40_10]|uniref:Uncharacterized protein n=1 Tax=Candidatus Magasanikbacteria bacterium GW2011_GWA2_40_10 TaxID=1619037 RepID=A0A0G0Q2G0_9BACT|nr:MAG: hypothetical protein UT67_C0012G0007 [Candidatus Magasanikbacteria bacterium GW2011_GWA2_40_10]
MFNNFDLIEPSDGLLNKILNKIKQEKRLSLIKKRLIGFSLAIFFSAGAIVPAFFILKKELFLSGFYRFLSVSFSDFGLIVVNWRDFSLVLLESLPATSIIMTMIFLLVFVWSFKNIVQIIINYPFTRGFINN